jgi:hypothetical protein
VRFARQHVPHFDFTSVQVNKNYESALHCDRNNLGEPSLRRLCTVGGSLREQPQRDLTRRARRAGPSFIVGVGEYSDGELWVHGRNRYGVQGARLNPLGLFLNPPGLFLRTSIPFIWRILSAFLRA